MGRILFDSTDTVRFNGFEMFNGLNVREQKQRGRRVAQRAVVHVRYALLGLGRWYVGGQRVDAVVVAHEAGSDLTLDRARVLEEGLCGGGWLVGGGVKVGKWGVVMVLVRSSGCRM